MRGEGSWGHTGVGDADVGQTVDAKFGVDDTALVARQHGAGRRGVELSAGCFPNPLEQVIVALDSCTGGCFVGEGALQRVGLANEAGEFDTVEQNIPIFGMLSVLEDLFVCLWGVLS